MTRNPHDVLLRPVVSEKSYDELELRKYRFKVAVNATKSEIGSAVEALFNVKVHSVNTIRVPGKARRLGRNSGRTPDWKKAIVTLQPGDRIDLFEQ